MKARHLALVVVALLAWSSKGITSTLWDQPLGRIEAQLLTFEKVSVEDQIAKSSPVSEEYEPRKSVKKAFLLSALLPGLGEYYAGSTWRTLLFGSTEVLAWTGYFVWHKQGKDKEDKFRDYADDNWDFVAYKKWVNDWARNNGFPDERYYGDGTDDDEDWDILTGQTEDGKRYLPASFIHDVVEAWNNNRQQYYEMIGKYYVYQFGSGWTDNSEYADTADNPYWRSTMANHYEDMRYDSNKLLDRARWGLGAALINRVLSAADAALVANSHNRRVDRFNDRFYNFKVRAGVLDYCGEPVPQLIISRRF